MNQTKTRANTNNLTRRLPMFNSSQDAMRQLFKDIQKNPTIENFNASLREKKICKKVLFSTQRTDFLKFYLPIMILNGLEDFNVEVALSTKFEDICKIDLMPIPQLFYLMDWERILIGKLKSGLEEIITKW